MKVTWGKVCPAKGTLVEIITKQNRTKQNQQRKAASKMPLLFILNGEFSIINFFIYL